MNRAERVVSALGVAVSGGLVLYFICPWLGVDSDFCRLLLVLSTFAYFGGLGAAFYAAFGPEPSTPAE